MRKLELYLMTVVCTLVCCCFLTVPTLAVGGTCGESAVWELDETTGELTISGTGVAGSQMGTPWRDYTDQIVSVTVEDGITELTGDSLFSFHDNLTTVTIADSVRKIGQGVFSCCYALSELDLPAECELGNAAFSNCTALTEFTFPLGTTVPGTVLSSCTGLEKVIIPEGYTRIDDYAFYSCSNLQEVVLPESLKSMEIRAFGQCIRLEQLVLKGTLDTLECVSGTISIPSLSAIYCFGDAPGELTGYAEYSFNNNMAKNFSFYYVEGTAGWENMTAYPIAVFDPSEPLPEFRTKGEFADEVMEVLNTLKSGVKPYTGYLKSMTELETCDAKYFPIVQEIALEAVEGCTTDREKILAIHNFTADWYYYDYDFYYNGAPQEYLGTMGAFSLIQYQETGDMRYRVGVCEDYANLSCMLLRALGIPSLVLEGVAYNGIKTDGHAWNAAYDGTEWIFFDSTWNSNNKYYSSTGTLTSRPAGGSYFNMSADYALWGGASSMARTADRIYGVEAGDVHGILYMNWDSLKMDYYVRGQVDADATEIVIPEQVGGPVRLLGTALDDNPKIERVICGADFIEEKAFEGCTELKEVILTDHVTTIGRYAFYGLPELETVSWQASSIPRSESFGLQDRAFGECPKLKSVVLPNEIKTMGSSVFEYCASLETVKLPAELDAIGSGAFMYCSNLRDVTIPDTVEIIKDCAFMGCSSLQEISLPESLKEIQVYGFYGCSALEKMHLPESVTTLGDSIFSDCTALTEVYIPDAANPIGTHMFKGCASLKDVRLPAELTAIPQECFNGCSALEYVEIPETVVSLGYCAFAGCAALREIHLPDGLQTVGQECFLDCSSLRVLYIPDSVQTCEPYFVMNCASLEGLYIGGGIDAVYYSGFPHMPSLKWVRLPETVTYCEHISNWDDWNVVSLEAVIFSGPLPNRGESGATGFYGAAKVYYPADEPSWLAATPSTGTQFIPYHPDGTPKLDTTIWFNPVATCLKPNVSAGEMTLVVATYDQQGRMTSVGVCQSDPWDVPIYDVNLTIFEMDAVLQRPTAFWLDRETLTPVVSQITT